MAGFVFLCMLFNQHPVGNSSDGTNSGPLLAVISSNQSGSFPILALPRQQNRPASDTFEWTNGSGSFSSVRSLLGLKSRN
jgi:hypothetical protein